jgi:hypothetical protein
VREYVTQHNIEKINGDGLNHVLQVACGKKYINNGHFDVLNQDMPAASNSFKAFSIAL